MRIAYPWPLYLVARLAGALPPALRSWLFLRMPAKGSALPWLSDRRLASAPGAPHDVAMAMHETTGLGRAALALRLARREMRGGLTSLRIVLACLALGVAAIAAVGTLRAAIQAGLQADGATILGGDLELRTVARPAAARGPGLGRRARRARCPRWSQMRAMPVAPDGERMLVELKAVDGAYPLFGALVLDPPGAR